jgi:hypothetical protein
MTILSLCINFEGITTKSTLHCTAFWTRVKALVCEFCYRLPSAICRLPCGGLGLKDIKTTARNGSVIGICRVRDEDEVMMITAQGQIQRIAVSVVRVMGRNTQGVRLMNLDEGDTLVAVKRIPKIESETADGRRGVAI